MVNSVSTLNSIVDLVYPTPYIQTFEEFTLSKQSGQPRPVSPVILPTETPNGSATTPVPPEGGFGPTRNDYDVYKIETIQREKRDVSKRIIKDLIWVIASGILLGFALHEKKSLKN